MNTQKDPIQHPRRLLSGRKRPLASSAATLVAGAGLLASVVVATGPVADASSSGLGGFSPVSLTYVSASQGWVLGTVPCGSSRCLKLLHTTNDGGSWSSVPVPAAREPQDSPALRVRFADSEDGWIYSSLPGQGPELGWSTHTGGQHWSAIKFPVATSPSNQPGVEDIEAAAGVVTAAVQLGDQIEIFSSPVGHDAWQRTGGPYELGAGPVPAGQLALQGRSGWFVENDRVVVSGGRETPSGKWASWTPPCSQSGGPDILAASTASRIDAVCTEGVWTGKKVTVDLLTSTNGGNTWGPSRLLPFTSAEGATAIGPSTVAVGTTVNHNTSSDDSLEMSFDGGATWRSAYSHVGAGWLELGFTTLNQGVAIVLANPGQHNIMLFTVDGGRHWAPVSF
jgi:hypothetical protein